MLFQWGGQIRHKEECIERLVVLCCDRPYGRHYRIAAGSAKMTEKLVGSSLLVPMYVRYGSEESAKSAGTKTRRREQSLGVARIATRHSTDNEGKTVMTPSCPP
jgi:hypothetical protein